MKKILPKELVRLKSLVEEGKSLNQISQILARGKTTIYYHFKKIKGRTFEPINIVLNNDELIGEFLGLFAGDGSLFKTTNYHYRTYLHFNSTEEIFVHDLIENVLVKLFGKEPMVFTRKNAINLCYYSKNIHKFIREYLEWDPDRPKTYSVRLKNKDHSVDFIKGFIRGSLDSDGYLSSNRISFATVSTGLKDNIVDFLIKLEIIPSVRLYKEKRSNRVDIYHISILKKDHEKFLRIILPRNKKDLNAPAGIRISEDQVQRSFPDHRLTSK